MFLEVIDGFMAKKDTTDAICTKALSMQSSFFDFYIHSNKYNCEASQTTRIIDN